MPYDNRGKFLYGDTSSSSRQKIAFDLPPARPKTRTRTKIVKVVVPPDLQADAVESLPQVLKPVVKKVLADPDLAAGVRAMMPRMERAEGGPMVAILAGIGLVREARDLVDDHLDKVWANTKLPPTRTRRVTIPEVVIGSGISAAIYCAVRVKNGAPPPLVLDGSDRAGGVFSVTRNPSFFLNSRNRPGVLSIPGDPRGALNFLPGAPIQPSHLSGDEFQTNDVLAWVIRVTLAMNAKVITGQTAQSLQEERMPGGVYPLKYGARFYATGRERPFYADRLIITTGLGIPRQVTAFKHDRVLTFLDFMRRFDGVFPLAGFNRVAVIGGGDSAKTAIEALTGKGPRAGMSIAALDWPTTIDWYGARQRVRVDWLSCNRPRYAGISTLLPTFDNPSSRVNPRGTLKGTGAQITEGYDCVLINSVPYDYIINCAGFTDVALTGENLSVSNVQGRPVGLVSNRATIWKLGAASALPASQYELDTLKGISENSTSVFRYADLIATAANSFK